MNKKLGFFSSMAVAFIVLILVFLCIRFSGQGKFATHGGTNPSDVKCIYTSVWPDNEYTRLICEPESGTIEYILDGSNAGYYAIFYNNISEEEIQKYIDQLKTLGYAEEASASESVSTGVLLRKDENPSDVKCIYTSVWPDNEYTRLICEPESGTIEYILDGSNAGYYAIFYNNISEEEIQKYIDQLKTLGYAEEASASESVSTGVLLRKDETWISIAYSEGGFGIRISVEKS